MRVSPRLWRVCGFEGMSGGSVSLCLSSIGKKRQILVCRHLIMIEYCSPHQKKCLRLLSGSLDLKRRKSFGFFCFEQLMVNDMWSYTGPPQCIGRWSGGLCSSKGLPDAHATAACLPVTQLGYSLTRTLFIELMGHGVLSLSKDLPSLPIASDVRRAIG